MAKRLPKDREELDYFVQRALSDTGFFAREVLGMDTDRDGSGNPLGEPGSGGIRPYGPHQTVIEAIDDDSIQNLVIMCPRYSYKSSIVEAFITRRLLRNPDISMLLFMATQPEAVKRVRQIRDLLTENPIIRAMYPDLVGPVWKDGEFVTAHRQDKTLQSPSLFGSSVGRGATGMRPNITIFDDIVTDVNHRTPLGLQKCRETVERALSLGSRGERYIMVCTPYHPADAVHWAKDAGWKVVELDVGYDIIEKVDDNGRMTLGLDGEGRWPNLSKSFLEGKLRGGMSFQLFMSQFKLRCVSGMTQAVKRTDFQPVQLSEEQQAGLSGFLLTDVAPSGSPKGDFNVLLYVGLDENNRIYFLDCEIGHWKMYEFCDRYLAMLQRWQAKLNHRMEVWEKSSHWHPYLQHIHSQAKQRQVRVAIHGETRNQSSASKDHRIASMLIRFQAREVFVASTMPKTWNALTETRVLWDPEGHHEDPSHPAVPGGEIVEQFIRFPHHRLKDIPDTLALLGAVDKASGARVCSYAKPAHRARPDSVVRQAVQHRTHGSAHSPERSRVASGAFRAWRA